VPPLLALLALAGGRAELHAQPQAAKSAPLTTGSEVWSLAYSPDGKTLVTSGDSDYVKLWEVAIRKERTALRGHNKVVGCVAFSSDGTRWATGSGDTTVVVWDAAKREELFTLKGHSADIAGVAFAPDGKTLVALALNLARN
jgi:WD40 repeat protein